MSTFPGAADPSRGARQLARGISATWWYTVIGVIVYEALVVTGWVIVSAKSAAADSTTAILGAAGLVWVLSTAWLLASHRRSETPAAAPSAVPGDAAVDPSLAVPTSARPDPGSANPMHTASTRTWIGLGIALACGAALGIAAGSCLLGLLPIVQSFVLVSWRTAAKLRLAAIAVIVLVCLAVFDAVQGVSIAGDDRWVLLLTVLLPVATASSLWWWDVVVVLDRARASEAKLAATQERLRVAADVHDLHGHHLQIIALQLELSDRLGDTDPEAAREQLHAARLSVDEARQGTRDLAARFRSVLLSDELANVRDLLTAAGMAVDLRHDSDVDLAPVDDLGPVIRETATNAIRHGGGTRARIALTRRPEGWRYEIVNDRRPGAEEGTGSGIEGIRQRILAVGGTVEVLRGEDFTVVVTIPAPPRGARP
ncbi:sensor histidine kinase [Brevibacterium casei]